MEARLPCPAAPGHFAERGDGGPVLTLEEEALGSFAPPRVWVLESCHEFEGGGTAQARGFDGLKVRRRESPDTSSIAAAFQVHGGVDVVGNAPGMLDIL